MFLGSPELDGLLELELVLVVSNILIHENWEALNCLDISFWGILRGHKEDSMYWKKVSTNGILICTPIKKASWVFPFVPSAYIFCEHFILLNGLALLLFSFRSSA